ncbi:hypothetical protein HK101_002205 [Irineochytrium annulatum]|nr:hypothetical protein HK101_002205 [Irineochytrium annulatum]
MPSASVALPVNVLASLVDNVRDHADRVSMMLVCKAWTKPVAEAAYRAPPLESSDSFERLMVLLNTVLPALPYAAMIRELNISGLAADNLYIGDLDAALRACTELEVFRLENCYHVSNILVKSVAQSSSGLLQLDLPGCPVSDTFIPLLTERCSRLLRLDFSFTNATVASIHSAVSNSSSLLELDLSECQEAEDLQSLDLTPRDLKRPLKSINLRNTPVTDDLLRFAAVQCPDLEIVVLESCGRITDDAVITIVNSCPRLRSLDCSFTDISDKTVHAIAARGAESVLEELYLSACDNVSPNAVLEMVQQTRKLELFVLDGCDRILGTFVQALSSGKGADGLECTLEGEHIKALAAYVHGSLATPPASPARTAGSGSELFNVEVTYSAEFAEEKKRKTANAGFAAAVRKSLGLPAESGKDKAATAAGAAGAGAGGRSLMKRRSSRTLRHRRSLLKLSSREEEDEEADEAARQERQEKIKEVRRSRGLSINRGRSPPSPPPSAFDNAPAEGVIIPNPSAGADSSAKAAFLLAAATKGVKVAPPGSAPATPPAPKPTPAPTPASTPAPVVKKPIILNLTANEFVPTTAPAPAPRKMSVGTPAGPPTGAPSWSATGIATSSVLQPVDTSAAAPAAGPADMSTDKVLLFSGRAARSASLSRDAAPAVQAPAPEVSAESETPGVIVIASGRRRSRANSLSLAPTADGAAATTSAATTATITPAPASPAPAPTSNWGVAAAPATAAQWGTDPVAWTPGPLAARAAAAAAAAAAGSVTAPTNSVDSWARAPQIKTSDPWAAPPTTHASAQFTPPVVTMPPVVASPAPVANWAIATNSPATASPTNPNGLRMAAGAGWSSQPAGLKSSAPAPRPQRPTVSGGRFGSVGSTRTASWSPAAGAPNSPPLAQTATAALVPATNGGVALEDGQVTDKEPFTFSSPDEARGRQLLKLRIETKVGGHQALAVHEFDDPTALASEFVKYWSMEAFKEPLVRLISVRKSNVLRTRAH